MPKKNFADVIFSFYLHYKILLSSTKILFLKFRN